MNANSILWKALNKSRLLWHRSKTSLYYRLFFQYIGTKSTIVRPIHIGNPQNISIGNNVFFRDHCRIEALDTGTISVGDNSSFEQCTHITSGEYVEIGANVTVSYGAMITDTDHNYCEISKHILKQGIITKPTTIGQYCFIGAGAKIQAGTTLGEQCIVGTNSVVRGIFPSHCVIVGAPAKIIKRYCQNRNRWLKCDPEGHIL